MEQLGPTGRIVIKFDIWVFSKTCQDNCSLIWTWHEWRVLYMKTNVHLWSYLPEFFLEWEIFRRKFVEKIETHLYSETFCENRALYDRMWKYVTARQTAHQNIMLHRNDMLGMRDEWGKNADTHSEYLIPSGSYGNNGYANAPQCYLIRILPVLFTRNFWCKMLLWSLNKG